MVSALFRQDNHPDNALWREVDRLGGEWVQRDWPAPEAILEEARAHDARALVLRGGDVELLRGLPALEFLTLLDPDDVAPAHALDRLRSLTVTGWGGRLDARAWPSLEWFAAAEVPRGGGGVETVLDHPHVRHLSLDGLNAAGLSDLAALTAPRLEVLDLARGSRVTSVAGLERHADRLRRLSLSGLSGLTSLAGIGELHRLHTLELESLRGVTTLVEVAAVGSLRFLDVSGLKGVSSLAPLAGHPALEFVAFDKTGDLDLSPLAELPGLRAVSCPRVSRWRGELPVPRVEDLPADDPLRAEFHAAREAGL